MNNESLLRELKEKLATGELSREQLSAALAAPLPAGAPSAPSPVLTRILYVLGAAIAVVGIVIFVGQVWKDLGSAGRILVTLGLGACLAAAGSALYVKKPESPVGTIFHAMGGLLIPGGAMVALSEMSVDQHSIWPVTLTIGAVAAFYLALSLLHKRVVLTVFAYLNATAFAYLLTSAVLEDTGYRFDELYAWLTMAVGACWLLSASAFRGGWNRPLAWVWSWLGSVAFLGAAISQVWDSVPWQVAYCFLLAGGLYASVHFKSRTLLAVTTLYLLGFVSFITSEYFADSLGWPLALVLLGFAFIGLGYGSISLGRTYAAKK